MRQLTFYFKGLMATAWTGESGEFKLILQIGASTNAIIPLFMPLSVAITGIANQPQHHPHATTEETERDGNVDPGPTKLGSNGAKPGVGNQTDAASLRFRQARVKNTGMGCHFLFQGIFQTQGLNPGLLHCRQTLYGLSPQASLPSKTLRTVEFRSGISGERPLQKCSGGKSRFL